MVRNFKSLIGKTFTEGSLGRALGCAPGLQGSPADRACQPEVTAHVTHLGGDTRAGLCPDSTGFGQNSQCRAFVPIASPRTVVSKARSFSPHLPFHSCHVFLVPLARSHHSVAQTSDGRQAPEAGRRPLCRPLPGEGQGRELRTRQSDRCFLATSELLPQFPS